MVAAGELAGAATTPDAPNAPAATTLDTPFAEPNTSLFPKEFVFPTPSGVSGVSGASGFSDVRAVGRLGAPSPSLAAAAAAAPDTADGDGAGLLGGGPDGGANAGRLKLPPLDFPLPSHPSAGTTRRRPDCGKFRVRVRVRVESVERGDER